MASDVTIDERVIEACQKGDREAFRLLFEAYKDKVYSISLYYLQGDEASARDITQGVFLKLMTKIEQFRHRSEFTTWLYRLVANACMDEQRKRRRFIFFGDGFKTARRDGSQPSAEARYEQLEMTDAVQAAVYELKPKLRLPILLKYVEGMSYEEMAAALDCSTGTIASRLNRGHKILARRLAHLRAVGFHG